MLLIDWPFELTVATGLAEGWGATITSEAFPLPTKMPPPYTAEIIMSPWLLSDSAYQICSAAVEEIHDEPQLLLMYTLLSSLEIRPVILLVKL